MRNIFIIFLISFISLKAHGELQEMPPEEAIAQEEISEDAADADEIDFSSSTLTLDDRYAVRRTVKEAHFLFTEALMYYEQGKKHKASRLFHEALYTLNQARIDSDTQYKMKESMGTLFIELEKNLSGNGKAEYQHNDSYSIHIDTSNELVNKYLKLYTEGGAKERIRKALERSGRYRGMISEILQQYGLPRELIYLPIVESLYSINDLSGAGALGIWQIMPERARALGLKVNHWVDERKDPEKSTRAAAQYLKELYTLFDDWHLALAAYNRGEFGLSRDLQFSKALNIQQMRERHAVPLETEYYVPQFIASTIVGDNYERYGLSITFEKPFICDDVTIDKVIDLEVVAKCAGVKVETIRELNPSIKAWCTPYNYPGFTLHLPGGTKNTFLDNLSKVEDLNPSRGYIKYRVTKGDYLGKLAKKFSTSVTAIKEDNKIKNLKTLRIGQVLIIRPGRKYPGKS